MTDSPTGKSDQQNGEVRDFTPSSSDQAVNLNPGAILFEKFRVIKLLGRGGMGSVYQVQHLHLRTEYALKCLNRQQHNDAAWRRFENEARASNKLDHPNLIKVHDSGLLPDGQPYFVMDLVNGITLADEIKKTGRLPLHAILKLFIQVGFALSYAHEHGVIHRDIKPTNIMLVNNKDGTLSNSVKVVDFGIAKLTGQDEFNQQTLTKTGEIFGSPLYMSPEQCMGVAVDHRSDLYSLGCVIFEASTGAPPFVGDNALSTMMKHQSERPLTMKEASLGIEFPEQLESMVRKLLEKDPADRYSNASLLAADLVALEQNLHSGVAMSLYVDDIKHKAVTLPDQVFFGSSKSLALLLVAVLCAYGLGVVSGVMWQKSAEIEKVTEPRKAANQQSEDLFLPPRIDFKVTSKGVSVQGGVDEKIPHVNYKPRYFTNDLERVRVFHFPKEVNLGIIESATNAQTGRFGMKGDVSLAVPAHIWVNDTFLDNPSLMSKFRDDEIACLRFQACEKPVGSVLAQTSTMINLIDIELGDSPADSRDLKYLERIPNLVKLAFDHSYMTINDVIRFKKISNLTRLGVAEMKDVKPLMKILPKLKKLVRLDMPKCKLDAEDLNAISKIEKLSYLDLTAVAGLNDKTLPILLKAQFLSTMDLERCKLTRASIPTLQGFPRLVSLRLTDPEESSAPNSFRSQFEKALPRLQFIWLDPLPVRPDSQ